MALGQDWILAEIETQWNRLAGLVAQVPAHLMEGPAVVGTWSVKDLLGHITTWESETMDNVQSFLDPHRGDMRSYADPDSFNEEAAQWKRVLPLSEVTRDLEETHARLIQFLNSLPEAAFQHEEVFRRIKLDTYDHYQEHAETLSAWRESEGS